MKPRKPVGAVSMFGGVDIAAAVKKRADSLSPEGKQDKGKYRKFRLGLSAVDTPLQCDKVKFSWTCTGTRIRNN